MYKTVRLTIAIIICVGILASCSNATGKYCLAFWRECGSYENGGGGVNGGNHVVVVHVWDENGNPKLVADERVATQQAQEAAQ